MNRQPVLVYILRILMGAAVVVLLAMLYWSSVLQEQALGKIHRELAAVEAAVTELQGKMGSYDGQFATVVQKLDALQQQIAGLPPPPKVVPCAPQPAPAAIAPPPAPQPAPKPAVMAPPIQKGLPNLLVPDPYFAKTLPAQLGPTFIPHGTRRGAMAQRPDNFHPFSNWAHIRTLTTYCLDNVAHDQFGKYETLSNGMALKMEAKPTGEGEVVEYWVYLRPGLYWQPLQQEQLAVDMKLAPHFLQKHPVTAADFKFYVDALLNPFVAEAGAAALRTFYSEIEEVRVIDDLTFVVRWRPQDVVEDSGKRTRKIKYISKQLTGGLQPLPSWIYKYYPDGSKIIEDNAGLDVYRTDSVWAQNFSQHWANHLIVSCGPWTFDSLTDKMIRYKRNPDYYIPGQVLTQAMEIEFKESPDAIWQDFKAGKLDMYELAPEKEIELKNFLASSQYAEQVKKGLAIQALPYVHRSYAYIGWNETSPLFSSKKVRQALSMAIDANRIIEQFLNGQGVPISGPFFRYSPSYDETIKPYPYDPQQARRLLEEEGWRDTQGDGVLYKTANGKKLPFRFELTYYSKSPRMRVIVEYIATSLREIGIDCKLNGVDTPDLTAAFDDKTFDAIALAWMLGSPPEDPKQLWHSSGAKEKGSSNFIGFSNKEADELIEKLQYEYDPQKRLQLYHRFHAIIHDEAPYAFLFTPKNTLLYRAYVQNLFIPADHQDIVPGANVTQPDTNVIWLKQ